MKAKITKRSVEAVAPGTRDAFLWDTEVPGFGCKITPKGARIYVLQYWRQGRTCRYTLGRHGVSMTAEEARKEAIRLKGHVAGGGDPAGAKAAEGNVPRLEELSTRYLEEHAAVKKKARSAFHDGYNLRKYVLPVLGRMRVNAITRADVARFHAGMKQKPATANRCLALLSKMFNLAEQWGLRSDGTNPTRHVQKYPERKIERFLSEAERARLGRVLAAAEASGEHPSVVAGIRLLIFTGCRLNEILRLRWEYVDLGDNCLRLPDSKTGARIVPLAAPALEVLSKLERIENNPYVLPGHLPGRHYVALEKAWRKLRAQAGLSDVRLHDLRHSFASVGAAIGESLTIIGAVLGHAAVATTARYAHLSRHPVRAAADRIAGTIAAAMDGKTADVVSMRRG